jgi:hypothetical protein
VVQKTLIDGRVYFDRQRDIADRPGREKEKKALLEKEKKSEKKPEAGEAAKKPGEKKMEEKKPEEKKPEEKPKPPQASAVAGGAE